MEICKANHDLECCRCNSGACENRKEFDSSGIEIEGEKHNSLYDAKVIKAIYDRCR